MAKVSITMRELQQNLKQVMQRVERGEVVEVTRRRRPVSRLAPLDGVGGPTAPWPDLAARSRAVFGKRVLSPSGSQLVDYDRGER